MKKLLFLVLLLLSLSACAIPQKQPIVAQGKKFYDPNPPSINLKFPFNIFYQKEEVIHNDYERIISHHLTTDRDNIYLYIQKNEINLGSWQYTGVDNKMKNKQFEYNNKTNSCIVYIYEENLKHYLLGTAFKHIGENKLNKVVMGKYIGYVFDPDRWALQHGDEIKEFITVFEKICYQFVE